MPEHDIQIDAIGQVFAQSLVNLARQQHALEAVTEDVRGLGAVLDSTPALAAFFEAASINPDQKLAVIEKAFTGRIHPLVLEILKSLARRDRLMFIRSMMAAYERILQRLANRVDVELVTSQELSPASNEKILAAVTKSLGKTPDFKTRTDPSLLGGIRLRVGDTMVDASVATQLKKIQQQLLNQGSNVLQKRFKEMFDS